MFINLYKVLRKAGGKKRKAEIFTFLSGTVFTMPGRKEHTLLNT